ncbi:hypothetical protein AB0J74_17705 [Asanoa sp. NPDC049573]|uniref:hypothetical protein n=1 Tax=Asanoa sp. NPDC049573 TaxID=3155396 RepID=UPI0034425DCC
MRQGFLGRLAAVVVAGVLVATGLVAGSAQAAGSCNPAERGYMMLSTHTTVRLERTANCTYYGRLVETHPYAEAGITFNIRVERREGGSITSWRQINIEGPYGEYNTAAVDGWWSGAASQDQHHVCYAINYGFWTCTGWVDI